MGHLPLPPGTFIDEREISSHADARLGFLTGGSQAEPMSAMVRIAHATHPRLRLSKGDVVVLSSRFIPGNERLIHRLINDCIGWAPRCFTKASRRCMFRVTPAATNWPR